MFEKDDPNDNQRRKAQYQLDRLRDHGLAHRKDPERGGVDGTKPARYYATDPSEDPSEDGV